MLLLILLVGASCGYLHFYQSELNYPVACSGIDTLTESQDFYQFLIDDYDYNIIYVVNGQEELPSFYDDDGSTHLVNGVAYPTLNYAVSWRYVHVINHEIAHLSCECNWHG